MSRKEQEKREFGTGRGTRKGLLTHEEYPADAEGSLATPRILWAWLLRSRTVKVLLPAGHREVDLETRHHPAMSSSSLNTFPLTACSGLQFSALIQTASQKPSRRKVLTSPHLILLGESLEGGSLQWLKPVLKSNTVLCEEAKWSPGTPGLQRGAEPSGPRPAEKLN